VSTGFLFELPPGSDQVGGVHFQLLAALQALEEVEHIGLLGRELGDHLHGVDELGDQEHAPEASYHNNEASEVGQRVKVTETHSWHSHNNEPEAVPHVIIVEVFWGAWRNILILQIFIKSSINTYLSEI